MADTTAKPVADAPEKGTTETAPAVENTTAAGEAKATEGPTAGAPSSVPESATVAAPVITDAVPPVTAPTSSEPPATEKENAKNAPADPSVPTWPELAEDHPIRQLEAHVPGLIEESGHDEVYGLKLNGDDFHKKLILQKFLRANQNDVEKAKAQLLGTLKWRKEFNAAAAKDEVYSKKHFGGLGYVTVLSGVPESPNEKDVVTFNIYGAVKDNKATFGDIESFLRWRVGLMELGLEKLNLAAATKPIPDFGQGPDPYQGIQIHDYLSVSFLRQDPHVKAASKKTIDVFSSYYPETLSRKFFVNVPVLMGWVFAAFKLVLPKETIKKFTVLSYGNTLNAELGPGVPEAYGGKGGALATIGETLKENDDGEAAAATA